MDLETEIKLTLLDEDPKPLLEAALGPPRRRIEQLNRYYLPASPKGVVVRLREEDGALILTVKGGGRKTPSGVFIKPEANEVIAPEWLLDAERTDGIPSLFQAGIMEQVTPPLEYVGQSRNTRWLFDLHGYVLELDHTYYPDGSDSWEIELETDEIDPAMKLLLDLMARASMRCEPSGQGKFARLLQRR